MRSSSPENRRVTIAMSGVFPALTDPATDIISIPMGRHNFSGELNPEDSHHDSRLENMEKEKKSEEEDEGEEENESEGSQAEEVDEEEDEMATSSESDDVDEIRGTQRGKAFGVSIPKAPFRRLVREIGILESEIGSDLRFTGEAMDILQQESEKVIVEMFTGANALAAAAKRQLVRVTDVYANRKINEILKKSQS